MCVCVRLRTHARVCKWLTTATALDTVRHLSRHTCTGIRLTHTHTPTKTHTHAHTHTFKHAYIHRNNNCVMHKWAGSGVIAGDNGSGGQSKRGRVGRMEGGTYIHQALAKSQSKVAHSTNASLPLPVRQGEAGSRKAVSIQKCNS